MTHSGRTGETGLGVRAFETGDAEAVARLFAEYMRETYGAASPLSATMLLQAGQGRHFNLIVATDARAGPIGFAAWRETYDLHNAVKGGEIPDLFVERGFRGHALSVRLVAAVARMVITQGGKFVRGEVLLDDRRRQRLVHRIAVGFKGETVYLAGRAMRALAELADRDDVRSFLPELPDPLENREP